MARFGITSPHVFGVSMATMRPLVRRLGRSPALAEALWKTGWLEARIVAGFIEVPAALTPAGMDLWARDFDNWAVTDSTCLHLFCKSPLAWGRVHAWYRRRGEFQKRAAFALLAALAVHDRGAGDSAFIAECPRLIAAAADHRPCVAKAVNWALRQIGKRSPVLRRRAIQCARDIQRLGTPTARWIAADALRELQAPVVIRRIARRAAMARVTSATRGGHT